MRQLCNVTVLLLLFGLTSCQNNGDKQTTMSPVKVKVLRVSSSEIDRNVFPVRWKKRTALRLAFRLWER